MLKNLTSLNGFVLLLAMFSISVIAKPMQEIVTLGSPIDCRLGKECFIQNYFDHDPSPLYKDYSCGFLSYDGHIGTDFRVNTQAQMRLGIEVVAATSGMVIAVRDGEPDIAIGIRGKENLFGKDAGNSVILDHGKGWTTQYSHMRNGSVVVNPGQHVKKGQILGMLGQSGNADFPHLDFTVRYLNNPVDPFNPIGKIDCNIGDMHISLWDNKFINNYRYIETGILEYGFSDHSPSRLAIDQANLSSKIFINSPAVIFWVEVYGIHLGDKWFIDIFSPSGEGIVEYQGVQNSNAAIAILGAGIRRGAKFLKQGNYQARFKLLRGNALILEQSDEAWIGEVKNE